ncbi:type I restriction enzyme HsdR N-terminal domain-containing protein [Flaviaesturariibacter amylovorans]
MEQLVRNGAPCILCASRKKLIQLTPEEGVRQDFIQKLIEVYGVPPENIQVEVQVYEGETRIGRTDIVVTHGVGSDEQPLLVVECKRPDWPLIDTVHKQAKRYCDALGVNLLVLTNGLQPVVLYRTDPAADFAPLTKLPSYSALLEQKGLRPAKPTPEFQREADGWAGPAFYHWLEGVAGVDTPKPIALFAYGLMEMLLDTRDRLQNLETKQATFVRDCGLRYTTFGNVTGGSWTGRYRYFIFDDMTRGHSVVSISILGKAKTENDPVYGNSKGETMLLVAIDDFEKTHHSLQLALDRFITITGNRIEVWHDGTLTAGKNGSVKRSDVIDFVFERQPQLVREGRIVLGSIETGPPYTIQTKGVQELIGNLADYAILRDQFRRTVGK